MTVQSVDTRIATAIQDMRSAGAAVDDSRTTLHELLEEGPRFPDRDTQALTALLDAMQWVMTRTDAIAGALARIQDRLTEGTQP